MGLGLLAKVSTVALWPVVFLAVLLGAANAAGGYVVTERMLGMFAAKKPAVTTGKEA